MNDLRDYELHEPSAASPPSNSKSTRYVGVAVAVTLLTAGAVAIYVVSRPRPAPTPTATSAPTSTAKEVPPSLVGTGEPLTLPPLDASDALVRTLVQALTTHPTIAAWLMTTGLIRNFTVVTANIADGATPAKHLKALRPASAFRIVLRNGHPYVDPQSFERYTVVADAVASVDPTGAAKLYATLKPRIEEAHRDLQSTDQSFDRTLERAIVVLLNTPIGDGPIRLRPKGIGYAYEDERLEGLRSAHKQLLRMGPRNVRVIETRLREIALALGMQPSQLPTP